MDFSFDPATLPADLLRPLLLGFSGRLHLHFIAGKALAHSSAPGDAASHIAADSLLAAWGENPLDGNCAAALAGQMDRLPPIPGELVPVLRVVMQHWQPEVTDEARSALAGIPEEQLVFLRGRVAQQPRSLFWWHHLYEYARINADWSAVLTALDEARPPDGLDTLFSVVRANALLALGEPQPAAGLYRASLPSLPLPILEERLVTAWLRSGKTEQARDLLIRCAAARPWNMGLVHRLHELAVDGTSQIALPEGRTMIFGYSWNKADDLAETLDSLLASELGDAQVRILDNGSTDGTADVVRRFADRFGGQRAGLVSLPVNVGAPAARNWLMHLSEVDRCEHVAYIDDDISLPADWLGRLGAAARRYPEAGVWGCKVVNHDGPARVQCSEHNLTPDPGERETTLMSTIMLQDGDFGQADYIRPCASVTGCVHLFRTGRLLANGGFDLRFSPTQYDDLERDLRMVLRGGYAVYTGHLAIPHKRKTGAVSGQGGAQEAGATANMRKLLAKYESAEFEAMARSLDRVLLADYQAKVAAVANL